MAVDEQKLSEKLKLTLDYDQLTNCMRCGFCQTACPTFNETGLEAASPRGRIALMKAVYDDMMKPDLAFKEQMDLCLGCRACEPACPSDVKYGQLIEQTREAIASEWQYPIHHRGIRRVFMKELFPKHGRMRMVGGLLRFYQKSGLRTLTNKVGILKLFPQHMREMEAILPEASSDGVLKRWVDAGLPARTETSQDGSRLLVIPPVGEKVARVGLFRGCIMDVLFTETNLNTIHLLRHSGYEVVIPEAQTCCGALHAHAGETQQSQGLAGKNIDVFAAAGVESVATNAGGCGAILKEYDHLMAKDDKYREGAKVFASQVKDITELLRESARPLPFRESNHRTDPIEASVGSLLPDDVQATVAEAATTADRVVITYQDSCHLRNVMHVQNEPRQLLRSIPGVELRELQGADRCCGSAGIYNVVQPEMSTSVLDHKMEHVEQTQAQIIVTSNPGCLMQMQWGILRSGQTERMKAMHLVDLLAENVNIDDLQQQKEKS